MMSMYALRRDVNDAKPSILTCLLVATLMVADVQPEEFCPRMHLHQAQVLNSEGANRLQFLQLQSDECFPGLFNSRNTTLAISTDSIQHYIESSVHYDLRLDILSLCAIDFIERLQRLPDSDK